MTLLGSSIAVLLAFGTLGHSSRLERLAARQGTSGELTVTQCLSDPNCSTTSFGDDISQGCENAELVINGQYVEVCADGTSFTEVADSAGSFSSYASDGITGWNSADGKIRLNIDVVETSFTDNECKHVGLNIAFNGNEECYKPLDAPSVTQAPGDADTANCQSLGYDRAGDTLIWFNLGKNLCP